jgi:hypothetical protein
MTNQTIETIMEPAKETAKKIRAALKVNFPNVKFSVRTDVYSGGSSVNVSWTDLPLTEEVEKVINQFQSGSFNGMDDYYETSGYVMDGKRYVGAKYLFCSRKLSDERKQLIKDWMKENYYEIDENSYEYFHHFNKAEQKMMESEVKQPEQAEEIEVVNNDSLTVELIHNEEKNGLELKFSGKPSEGTRELLKSNGFRWSKYSKVWYIKNSNSALMFAESFVSAFNDTVIEEEEVNTIYFKEWEMDAEEIQNELNKHELKYTFDGSKFYVSVTLETYPKVYSIIETINRKNGAIINDCTLSPTQHANINELINNEPKPYEPNKGTLERIEKAVNSIQKKLDNLSGDYLTNTWKRMKEEESRQTQREQFKKEINLLNYLHGKIQTQSLTLFEETLITGSFRAAIDSFYKAHYEYKHEIKFPVIDYKYDLEGWYNKEVPTKQKRLQKGGINNTVQLLAALEQYKQILSVIDKPIDLRQHKIKKLESEAKFKNIPDYFPTPKTITDQLIDLADIEDNMSILEPSAGNGNIMDAVNNHSKENNLNIHLKGLEINFGLIDILKLKNYQVKQGNFLELNHINMYDRVIMNPPFSNYQDIEHVLHAYECLKDGGKLVAIMSEGSFFRTDKKSIQFREFLSDHGYSIELESGAFKDSGTMVKSRIVVIDKPESKSIAI